MMNPAKTGLQLGESVVDEVRAIREAIDEEVGHNVARLAAQARQVSEAVRREFGMKVARLPLPPPSRPATTARG